MSPIPDSTTNSNGTDWRVWLGLGLTGFWLLLGFVYLSNTIGWNRFASLPADQLGSFLEGAFAPLAFLWLVIGYFLQKQELEQNTQTLAEQAQQISRSAAQAELQSQRMAENERHARQEAFLQIAASVQRQLGSVSGLLYLSSQGANASGNVSAEEMSRLFAQQAGQDGEVFSRRLLELQVTVTPEEAYDLFYGTEIRARHSNHFIYAYERMLRRAHEVDSDNMIRDALMASSHGFVYTIAKNHQNNAPAHLASHELTGIDINIVPRPADELADVVSN